MTKIASIVGLSLLFCLQGCGYFSSGTWEDDPDNWRRAFQSKKPNDVAIIHSKYYRSPHWTYEFQYFFEIEHNDALKKQLFTKNQLIQLEGDEAREAKDSLYGEFPNWFAPKTVDSYEVWVSADRTSSNLKIFIDKVTGNLFLTDYQI